MKSIGMILSSAVFLFLLAAGAVVAEPPLPLLTFYLDDEQVESRRMTPREHTAFMKFQHASGVFDEENNVKDLTEASLALAAQSLSAAADAMTITKDQDDHVTINADVSIESLSEAVAEGGLELGKYAERLGKAAENLKQEIARNSGDLEYDSVKVGEEGDTIEISVD